MRCYLLLASHACSTISFVHRKNRTKKFFFYHILPHVTQNSIKVLTNSSKKSLLWTISKSRFHITSVYSVNIEKRPVRYTHTFYRTNKQSEHKDWHPKKLWKHSFVSSLFETIPEYSINYNFIFSWWSINSMTNEMITYVS